MSSIEIEYSDVVKLVLQFLKEKRYVKSFETLQNESGVYMNTVENIDSFIFNIKNGKWDEVLSEVSSLKLSTNKLALLYEHIILEFVEMEEIELARKILVSTPSLNAMKESNPARYKRLENIIGIPNLEAKDIYFGSTKEKRREEIIKQILPEINQAEPSRLTSIIAESLKYLKLSGKLQPGDQYDLFSGKISAQEEEFPPRVCYKSLKPQSKIEVVMFSPDGGYLFTGNENGIIEIWDYISGQLSLDFQYQKDKKFMKHESPITCINFSKNGDYLVSGSQNGDIKVWDIKSGKCLRKFIKCHTDAISSVSFNKQDSQILSSSFDMTVKIHGIKSGNTLKTFIGHSSYVNSALFSTVGTEVISCSTDGTIKVWDTKTSKNLSTFQPANVSSDVPINSITMMPGTTKDHFLVSNRSKSIYIMDKNGKTLKSFTVENQKDIDMLFAFASTKRSWIYSIDDQGVIYCFSTSSGKMEHSFDLHDHEVISFHNHPYRNFFVSCSVEGEMKFWKS